MKKNIVLIVSIALVYCYSISVFAETSLGVHSDQAAREAASKISFRKNKVAESSRLMTYAEAEAFFISADSAPVETKVLYVPRELWPAVFTFYSDGRVTHNYAPNNRDDDQGTWVLKNVDSNAQLCWKWHDWNGPRSNPKEKCYAMRVGSVTYDETTVSNLVFASKPEESTPYNVFFKQQ